MNDVQTNVGISAGQVNASEAPEATGPAAAAILAAGIGCFALGVLALAGDAIPAVRAALNIYNPSGPLSGVTTAAIVIWLATWFGLSRVWAHRMVAMGAITKAAFAMLGLGILLTFPPFMDLLQGK
jgi:hypothetical protein